ncbi:hypothetical protein TNCV_2886361 [Trichonephila clavipes]|nr:hypothetical protein TNCV_2886361 [Trichonephila clavipes]
MVMQQVKATCRHSVEHEKLKSGMVVNAIVGATVRGMQTEMDAKAEAFSSDEFLMTIKFFSVAKASMFRPICQNG